MRATFTAHPGVPDPQALPLTPADRELYTRPVEGLVNVTPAVRELAQRLAGTEPDPSRVVRRFWDFVLDELTCGIVDYAEVDPQRPTEHPLDTGWFDCQMSSALLVALCRSRGLPARIVSGYLLYVESPSIHWWVEVALPGRGWVPMDTMAYDLSARGRDAGWRDHFFGALDYRMKCECLPRIFNRSPGFRLPDRVADAVAQGRRRDADQPACVRHGRTRVPRPDRRADLIGHRMDSLQFMGAGSPKSAGPDHPDTPGAGRAPKRVRSRHCCAARPYVG